MLYPRRTKEGALVSEEQMVGVREHLSTVHRMLNFSGQLSRETESHDLLLALDSLSNEPIKILVSSPGGDLDSAFLFYDTMRLIKSPVITIGRFCASAAALILAAGTERYLLPHAKVMLHLPLGGTFGDSRYWEIQHQQMRVYKDKMIGILQECGVKKERAEILEDVDRDFWLEPQQAIEYGLADEILTPSIMGRWL